jgi:pimeloyl-ACP methyl ester carboxylesterase
MAKLEQKTGVKLPLVYVTYQTLGQLAGMYEAQLSPSMSKSNEQNANGSHQEFVDTPDRAESIEISSKSLSNASLIPFYFGPPDKSLFGCYHPPLVRQIQTCAVVLCYPFGHEYIRSHRAYQQLAIRLARAGFPVLRFDFFGCGDSEGEAEEGNFDQWLSNIPLAIAEVRERGGLQQICLVGLRLGATLAALASLEQPDIAGLVLWEPILNGKAYLEELTLQHQEAIWRFPVPPKSYIATNTPTELLGFPLSKEIVADLEKLNLLTIRQKSTKNVLIIEGQEKSTVGPLREHFQGMGSPPEYRQILSFKIWTEDPDKGLVPHQTLQTIVSWISEVSK